MSVDIHRNRKVFRAALVAVALAVSAWATHARATSMSCGEVAVSAWMYHGNIPPGSEHGNYVSFTEFINSGSQTYIAWGPGISAADIAQMHAAGKLVGVLASGNGGEAEMQELANRGFDWIILDEVTWRIWLASGYSPSTGAIAASWFNTLRNAAKSVNPEIRVANVEPFWSMMQTFLYNGAQPDMVMGEEYYDNPADGRDIRRVHLEQWRARGYRVGQWVVGTGHISDYSGTDMIVTSDWGSQPWGFANFYDALQGYCS